MTNKPYPITETHPQLASQWDKTNNDKLSSQVSRGSTFKAWWKCDQGHKWQARVDHRSRGSGCPYCSNQKVLPGYNDLATHYPELAKQIRKSDPSYLLAGSNQKVEWECDSGHTWITTVSKRSKENRGCPYCSGRRIIVGKTDICSTHPDLMKLWDRELNHSVDLLKITANSREKAWWAGECGHKWNRTIADQVRAEEKCPVCHNKIVISGVSDLEALYPDIYQQLLIPAVLFPGSSGVQEWVCDEGHQWRSTVRSRVKGSRCPYCSGRKALVGKTDLTTLKPSLAEEWHPTLNDPLLPTETTVSSGKKVWWQCQQGHKWEAWVYARTAGNNCPACSMNGTSNLESEIVSWVRSLGLAPILNSRTVIPPYEVDIYLPEHGFGIEVNGVYWHSEKFKDKNYHYNKTSITIEAGVTLFQIWEDDWTERPETIKRMILHRLGLSSQPSVPARKTVVKQVTRAEGALFLEHNHVQGGVNGSFFLGLKSKASEELVAVAAFNKRGESIYLDRYATSLRVMGGLGKLLKTMIAEHNPRRVITFADRSISQGSLYEATGFSQDKILGPDYSYLVGNKRVHKFHYRKTRFEKDPSLLFKEDMTERQLADLNNLLRIWDSGKVRYVLTVDNNK